MFLTRVQLKGDTFRGAHQHLINEELGFAADVDGSLRFLSREDGDGRCAKQAEQQRYEKEEALHGVGCNEYHPTHVSQWFIDLSQPMNGA